MRTNRSNRMMTTTTRSRSSRSVKPQRPVSRHSHKYDTWLLNPRNPVQYHRDYFVFAANGYIWSDIRTPKWRIWRQVSCFLWNYPVIITANIIYQDKTFSWFPKLESPSVRRCGLCSLCCMVYVDYTVSKCSVQCPDWLLPGRDLQIESLKRDLELLRAELERIKAEVRKRKHLVWFRGEGEGLIVFLFLLRRPSVTSCNWNPKSTV